MARFRRLTDAEARQLTRRELLDRVEAEQEYWRRKRTRTPDDDQAEREFRRIMYAYLGPEQITAAMQDLTGHIKGVPGTGGWWDSRPCDDGQPATRDPVIAYALRLLAAERDQTPG